MSNITTIPLSGFLLIELCKFLGKKLGRGTINIDEQGEITINREQLFVAARFTSVELVISKLVLVGTLAYFVMKFLL